MRTPTRRIAIAAAGGLAAAGAAAIALGARRWERASARAVARLQARGMGGTRAGAARAEALAGLPDPARRYLAAALAPDRPPPTIARLDWRGEFRLRPGGRWLPFAAVQHVAARPPGFVWDAAMRMAPLLAVRVRDGYADGEGSVHGALAGVATIVHASGTPEIAAGALARWLAEAVWLPSALLPGDGVTWTPIDDRTARATVVDRGVSVAVDFHFGERGEVAGVSGERYRDVHGTGVPTRWRARVWDHARVGGMLVPRRGEVEWLLPEGPFAYWRGRLADATYGGAR